MATGGPSGPPERIYEEDDKMDQFLLNQLSKWISYRRLPTFARSLRISQAEFERIQGGYYTPLEQTFQVLHRWHNKRGRTTVRELVSEMVEWTQNGFLDPEVWNNFRSKISPAALPANIQALAIPASELTVRDLIEHIEEWARNRNNNFRSNISPTALPANNETLALPAPSGGQHVDLFLFSGDSDRYHETQRQIERKGVLLELLSQLDELERVLLELRRQLDELERVLLELGRQLDELERVLLERQCEMDELNGSSFSSESDMYAELQWYVEPESFDEIWRQHEQGDELDQLNGLFLLAFILVAIFEVLLVLLTYRIKQKCCPKGQKKSVPLAVFNASWAKMLMV